MYRVLFNDTLSYDFETTTGVRECKQLGPIFFILYYILLIFKKSECKIYAEDVKNFKSVNSVLNAEQLQNDF